MANQRLRALLRWTKWADWAIAAVGFTIIIFVLTFFFDSSSTDGAASSVNLPASDLVDLTLLHNAEDRGALCLDGSLPGYHFQKGFGSGSNNWLLHIEGGGWCNTIESCSTRKTTALGSSNFMERQVSFSGILSSDPSQNPDFFSWNKVKIRYCDGASFAGRPESEFKNGTNLFFRGQLIWEALMDELLSVGMSNAKQAFLTGCSAGGLAAVIHCDDFRERLPQHATVKCLADASFFLDDTTMDNIKRSMVPHFQCLFPREFIKNIRTPVFIVNPAYDFWQIRNILVPDVSDPQGYWQTCRLNIHSCNPNQLEILKGFRNSLLNALSEFQQKNEAGMFVNSCYIHCQTWMAETWHSPSSPRINSKTIAESVGDWYFNRGAVKLIDCPYPCNPTCYNMDFTRH
ncbi:Pectin acetylesterase 5 [Citrus sinensis]|uniref:Pectin acetylesterase 5 n=1 Tax=Citrus sinensis TaxID=2711 RepID=A0ACB8JT21_CITSI|nr:Pectin acetylesterase 5 [Citrus sinensis]